MAHILSGTCQSPPSHPQRCTSAPAWGEQGTHALPEAVLLVLNSSDIFLCSFLLFFFYKWSLFQPIKTFTQKFFQRLALPASCRTVSSYYCTPDLHYLDFIAITMSIVNHHVCTQSSTSLLKWKPGDSCMCCKREAVLLGFVFSHQTPRAERQHFKWIIMQVA